jgi:hypothetical protein
MKQEDMRINGHYRLNSGARVQVLRKGLSGAVAGRRDHVRVKFVGGLRDGQEARISSREILRAWTAQDDERTEKRSALTKKVGVTRVKLAMLGFDGEEMTVHPRGDGSMLVQFHGDAAERVIEMLERASEEVA